MDEELLYDLKQLVKWIFALAIDAVFLILWAATQYYTNKLIQYFQPSGIDVYVFWIFQLMFGASTLAPIAMYIYQSINIIWIRTQRQIRAVREEAP